MALQQVAGLVLYPFGMVRLKMSQIVYLSEWLLLVVVVRQLLLLTEMEVATQQI